MATVEKNNLRMATVGEHMSVSPPFYSVLSLIKIFLGSVPFPMFLGYLVLSILNCIRSELVNSIFIVFPAVIATDETKQRKYLHPTHREI